MTNIISTIVKATITAGLLVNVVMAQVGTPSAAQIAQFKNLSPAQQQALANQYGISLNQLRGGDNAQPNLRQSRTAPQRANSTVGSKAIETNALEASNNVNLQVDQESKATGQVLKQFGYELFNRSPASFAPAADIPIPSAYVLGPGDSIVVQLYGKENASYDLTVNREGQVQFPNIGPINVAGLSFVDLKALINTTVKNQMIGVKASITMGELRSIRVFVLGEARRPGSYTVSSLSTMTNALFASGGIANIGSLRNIQLKRSGKLITTLDLYDLLLLGDTSSDARLLPGDVIFIPPIGKTVGVSGEVLRPAIYELKHETNTQQSIELAGGILPTAFPQASRIERINSAGDRTLVDLDLNSSSGRNILVKDADTIQIFSVLETMEDVVLVEGHIQRPGGFAFKQGQHFTDIVRSVDELLPNSDLNAALIVREQQPTRKIETILFSPGEAFTHPRSDSDPVLHARDSIIIFNYQTNRAELLADKVKQLKLQSSGLQRRQVVNVNGNVRFPGAYPLTLNMSAYDLITLAGGLTDRAYSVSAEITRYQFSDSEQQTIQHLTVNISENSRTSLVAEDHLHIRHKPNWVGTEVVTIAGEVAFPGTYTIQRGETLSQLIKRAGDLNEYASVNAAVFTREQLRVNEDLRIREMQQRMKADLANNSIEAQNSDDQIAIDDAEALLAKLQNSKATGRMVIDLAAIIERPDQSDVLLKDGDLLNVPRIRQAVTVIGEVQYSTSHIYNQNLSVDDYIKRSGDVTQRADAKAIYIVRANGSVYLPKNSKWFSRNDGGVKPGDTIVVPYDSERMKPLPFWTSVSQIIYQIALGAAAVNSL